MSTQHTQTCQQDDPANTDPEIRLLGDSELDSMMGGIAMLLPAVQAAREAARRNYEDEVYANFFFKG